MKKLLSAMAAVMMLSGSTRSDEPVSNQPPDGTDIAIVPAMVSEPKEALLHGSHQKR